MKRKKQELSPQETAILEALRSGESVTSAVAPLIRKVMEAALEEEMATHLSEAEEAGNRRNGMSRKTVKSSSGAFELDTPRDRSGSFDPQLVRKRQTVLTDDLDAKILSLYANGMSYADIRESLEDIYQTDISSAAISRITDRLLPELQEWQQRPLSDVYAVLYLDAVHFKVREDGRVVPKAVYSLLGVDNAGRKDILGLYAFETEGASRWAEVLADLKARGVEDILIACVDGLKGFPEAIHALFPFTDVQLCIIHQIRHSLRYVASKDQKAFMADLKTVYRASSRAAAEENLLILEENWGKKYRVAVRSWVNNQENLFTYFKYDSHVRKIIYTTNAVEGLHRMIRKYTKTKGAFTSQNALLKLVYCAYKKCLKKWTQPVQNWAEIVSQLDIHFPHRLKLENLR